MWKLFHQIYSINQLKFSLHHKNSIYNDRVRFSHNFSLLVTTSTEYKRLPIGNILTNSHALHYRQFNESMIFWTLSGNSVRVRCHWLYRRNFSRVIAYIQKSLFVLINQCRGAHDVSECGRYRLPVSHIMIFWIEEGYCKKFIDSSKLYWFHVTFVKIFFYQM